MLLSAFFGRSDDDEEPTSNEGSAPDNINGSNGNGNSGNNHHGSNGDGCNRASGNGASGNGASRWGRAEWALVGLEVTWGLVPPGSSVNSVHRTSNVLLAGE